MRYTTYHSLNIVTKNVTVRFVIRLDKVLAATNVHANDDARTTRATPVLSTESNEPILLELAEPVARRPITVPIQHVGSRVQPIIRRQRDAATKGPQHTFTNGI